MFEGTLFNQPIGEWNVSNVTNMESMFAYGFFNQPISNWDVSKVTNMAYMFATNYEFNQPIGNWDVSNVPNMENMFYHSVYSLEQPNVKRSIDKKNLKNLHTDVLDNTKKLRMPESVRKVLSLKEGEGPGIGEIKKFLGGKLTRKTRKHNRKSRQINKYLVQTQRLKR